MSLGALILVKYFKKHNHNAINTAAFKIEILSSLHLTSRDKFFVVRCGPDVIAFVLAQGGACLLGKWSYENWKNNEKLEMRSE